MSKILIRVSKVILALLALWLAEEILVRLYLQMPLRTNFYSSIKQKGAVRQREIGIRVVQGPGSSHLGWIADPEKDILFITTAGWPWEAALTLGEAAIAPLEWNPAP